MPSKTTAVYDLLKQDVIRLRFRRDEIINEKALAERYQVSKTPVREALSMLVQVGYLKKIPRVGYLVRAVTLPAASGLRKTRERVNSLVY